MTSVILAATKSAYRNTVSEFRHAFRRGTIEASLWERVGFILTIALILVFALFPFYVMALTSVLRSDLLYNLPPTLVPPLSGLTTSHYEQVLSPSTFPFPQYFANSLLVSVITAGLGVIVATFGGYSFARLDFWGRSAVSRLVLVVYMFSGILLVVPLFKIIVWIGLVDTLYSLIVTYLVQILPLSLYMLGSYFRSIPKEIEEAALMDGYSRVETILRVTLPLSAPAIVAVYMYSFMIAWNEYLFASIFLKSDGLYTLPIGIESLTLTFQQVWGQVMAASLMTSIPVIVMFLYLEKFMIEGLTIGAVEG